jgi:outer membrane protein
MRAWLRASAYGVALLILNVMAPASAAADEGLMQSAMDVVRTGSLSSLPGNWTMTLGLEGKAAPSFEGSGNLEIEPNPIIQVRPAGRGQASRFRSVRDSSGIALVKADGFYFGPVGKFIKARDEADHAELRGLGDVDWTLEVGVFAEYWPTDWWRTRIEVRRGFNGHEGFVADLSTDLVVSLMERWTLSGGPRMRLADSSATSPYYSITAAQSAASGLPTYDAGGGLRAIGAGLQVRYQWDKQWAARAHVEYDRLMSDAAASPLVTERGSADQFRFGLGLSYSFDISLW